MDNFYVYIMTNKSRTLYIGMTNHLVRRVGEHKSKQIDGFTKRYNMTSLVYYEHHTSARDAIRREKELKGWLRKRKIELIERENPTWRDLSLDWEEFRVIPKADEPTKSQPDTKREEQP